VSQLIIWIVCEGVKIKMLACKIKIKWW